MLRIGAVKMLISIRSIEDETRIPEFSQFILDGVKGKKAKPSKLTDVEFPARIGQ